jgi:signal peptidase I
MGTTRHTSAVVTNLILAVSLVMLWLAFAPESLGGRVTYVIVNGISMEPGYHLGDLTIMRKASNYQVGDVVTYRDAEMNAYVIHRIIGVDQGHYVLQGDNNSWIDAYRPTNEEIIGKLWIYIPKLGKMFKWLRSPLNLALTFGLFGGVLMSGALIKPSPHGKRRARPQSPVSGGFETGLYVIGSFVLVFLGLSIFSFFNPLNRAAENISYQQESRFSYSATGTPVIYDTEVVRSGEPVFPRLTCFLNIAFNYNVTGSQLQGISGEYQLIARVMDEQSGWHRTISMNERTPFNGTSFSTTSNLDVCQIVALVNTLKQETGLRVNNFMLEITPQVALSANALGNQIVDSFEPKLVFRFDEVHFSLSTPDGQEDPLYWSKQTSTENSSLEPNSLSILGWKLQIRTIRVLALVGLALSLSGLTVWSLRLFSPAQQNQEALIRLKYGGLLVNVYERNLAPASILVDVTSIDELAKLADRHNTVILHMALNFAHSYMVQCHGLTYRYVFSAVNRGAEEMELPRHDFINPMSTRNTMTTTARNEIESFSDMLNDHRVIRSTVTETVIMKKIKL